MNRLLFPVLALALGRILCAQAAPLEVEAKFVKVLLTSTGQFGFACNDEALKARLEAMGISVGPGFKFAWGRSEEEVRALKAQNRFIVCPSVDWFRSGACLALVEEDGRPQLYLHLANTRASGVTVPDAIARIARKQ
jgi:hypothetical protein